MAIINGTTASETINGSPSADVIYGFAGNDSLFGSGGADALVGGTGNDSLTGGSGNDIFGYDARNFDIDTVLDFATGDRIDLRVLNIGDLATVSPYLKQVGSDVVLATLFGGATEQITIKNGTLAAVQSALIFNTATDALLVEGSTQRDVLFGGKGADRLIGYSGDDQLNGGAGNDILIGGTGDDLLRGGAGSDIIRIDARVFDIDTVLDFATGDRIDLRALNIGDLATVSPYLNQVGSDVVLATLFGGATEQITIKNSTLAAVQSALIFNTATDALLVEGSTQRDVLFGGKGADRLIGYSGDDQLNGGAGNDILIGGTGDDLLRGGAGNDIIRIDARVFDIDTVLDFATGDRIDLRALNIGDLATVSPYLKQVGSDVVLATLFGGATEQITIKNGTLAAVQSALIFNTATDALLVEGSTQRDVLFGGKGADRLIGYSGDDQLNGGAGNDILIGGTGADAMRGGAGVDIFVFGAGDSPNSARDRILDFKTSGTDRIDLRPIDPSESYGDQSLTLVGGAFTAPGQAKISAFGSDWLVSVNLDSNFATAELALLVTSATPLVPADLIL